ncbi:hypothetical protein LguiB_005543 [Lonicera macranthoides]
MDLRAPPLPLPSLSSLFEPEDWDMKEMARGQPQLFQTQSTRVHGSKSHHLRPPLTPPFMVTIFVDHFRPTVFGSEIDVENAWASSTVEAFFRNAGYEDQRRPDVQ